MPVNLASHPIIEHKLTELREINTQPKDFRNLIVEITAFLGYEATRNLPVEPIEIETPMMKSHFPGIVQKDIVIVPVLRAGIGMVEGLFRLFPDARVGHIGIFREHDTLKPVEYYSKLPDNISKSLVFLVDPMLATGGSICAAIDLLKSQNVEIKNLKLLCILAAPEGVKMVEKEHPGIEIFIVRIDDKLNEKGYILPGLGDAGNRMFGT